MHYIFLRALCNTAFAQMLRLSQAKRPQPLGVITVNYLVATLVSLILAALRGRLSYHPPTLYLGALGGVGYVLSILVLMPAMRGSGVAVTVAVLQLAVLWPVAYAMLAFREMPSGPQWIGMAAAVGALVLLSSGRTLPLERKRARFSPLLPVLFLVTGISGIAMRAFHQYSPAQELTGFMVVLFATATLGSALAMAACREPLRRPDLLIGAAAGLPNAAQLEFLLRAMENLPSIVVFPVSSALSLMLNAIASVLWWGERLDRPTALGLALALAATVLLNQR
jgi:drug/metabolite transporter (DMT)-like permease